MGEAGTQDGPSINPFGQIAAAMLSHVTPPWGPDAPAPALTELAKFPTLSQQAAERQFAKSSSAAFPAELDSSLE